MILATLILLNAAIAGVALLRTAGWYEYGVAQSFAASGRCLMTEGGGGTPYGPRVLAVRAPGGLRGSAVFLDSHVSARRFASDMAATTSLQAMQRGPIVLVTPRRVEGLALRRLGSCLRVVETERLSDAFGAPFTRVRHPFGVAPHTATR